MIENDSIKLSETKAEDLPQIIEIEKKYLEFIGQYTMARHQKVLTNRNEKHLSIFNKSDNSLIGYVILAGLLNENHFIEFRRIALIKRGLGYGSMTLKLIKTLCFNEYGTTKIWLDVYKDNEHAIKLYTKEGFTKERELKADKKSRATYIMSIKK